MTSTSHAKMRQHEISKLKQYGKLKPYTGSHIMVFTVCTAADTIATLLLYVLLLLHHHHHHHHQQQQQQQQQLILPHALILCNLIAGYRVKPHMNKEMNLQIVAHG